MPPHNLELAVVLHGSGARAALTPQAHTKHLDVPNGSQGLIEALGEAGLPARTMLSQRHAFHAGNQADVLKHVVLTGVPGYLTDAYRLVQLSS